MSIWGKRVDALFTGDREKKTREDYNRAGLNAIWQVALVVIVALLAAYAFSHYS